VKQLLHYSNILPVINQSIQLTDWLIALIKVLPKFYAFPTNVLQINSIFFLEFLCTSDKFKYLIQFGWCRNAISKTVCVLSACFRTTTNNYLCVSYGEWPQVKTSNIPELECWLWTRQHWKVFSFTRSIFDCKKSKFPTI